MLLEKAYWEDVEDISRPKKNREKMKNKLMEFMINSNKTDIMECIDSDEIYNNGNDFRRSIQHIITGYALPLKVFMHHGKVYICWMSTYKERMTNG